MTVYLTNFKNNRIGKDGRERMGDKVNSLLAVRESEVRPLNKCVRPDRPVKINIRPGLIVYAKKGANVSAVKLKFKGK